ncbi:MAG: BMP family ABC transporter substrate-binding protein [Oscillospiraceae bacterium]|nr:BMP family ABC transporter substrate-binding protein [Oscillospiraceae bacterium]
MKKVLAVLIALSMLLCLGLAACKDSKDPTDPANPDVTGTTKAGDKVTEFDYNAVKDDATSADGKYEIAFVTDVGSLKDQSFNQGTWEGIKRYASENNKTYKYYQPANGDKATDDDRFNAMKAAADAGAKIVVCAGFHQETALTKAAQEFTDVKFVFIDGYTLYSEKDAEGKGIAGKEIKNVAPISFQEEQSGYLAGYAAVKDGYSKLGFTGGGGGEIPACCRFGYGFVQGANDAAKELNKTVEMKYSWSFGASFSPSPDLQTMLSGWYSNGTEVIFCCGGNMCQSAFEAAGANDGKVIGVDVDQSSQNDTVITSATKGLRESVMFALDKFYNGQFDTLGGVSTVLGANNDAVGLPTATWGFKNYTVDDYNKLLASIKDGSVKIDSDYTKLAEGAFANVNLTIVK